MHAPTLVFVYNSDSGFVNTLLDIGHKLVSPSTYACRLCALTHSTFHMRGEWKEFVAALGVSTEFLHRDELAARYGLHDLALPAVYLKRERGLELFLDHAQIDHCRTLADLERLVRARLRTASP